MIGHPFAVVPLLMRSTPLLSVPETYGVTQLFSYPKEQPMKLHTESVLEKKLAAGVPTTASAAVASYVVV